MNKHSESKHTEAVLILLVLTLFALGFVGIPVILYLTALLLLVYWTDSRAFFGLLVFVLCCLFRWVLLPIEHPIAL